MTTAELTSVAEKITAISSIGIPIEKICSVGFDNTLFVIKTDDKNTEDCTYLVLTDDEATDRVLDIIETEPHRMTANALFEFLPENSLSLDQLYKIKTELNEVIFDEIFCRMLEITGKMDEYVQTIYDTHTYDFFLSCDDKQFIVNGFYIYKV